MHVRSNTRKVSDSRKVFRHAPKFQNQAKFQAHADPRQNFIDPRNTHDPRKFSTHFTREPPYPRTNATHAIQQTLKIVSICIFLIHSESVQKMLTALFKLVCNTQKSTWTNLFEYQGKMFLNIESILVKISEEQP